MSEIDELNKNQSGDLDTLDKSTTVVERTTAASASSTSAEVASGARDVAASPAKKPGILRRFLNVVNIYLLLFILIIVLTGIGSVIFYLKAQNQSTGTSTPGSQSLSQNTLDSLANSDVTVGEPKHTLTVQSNAEFSGSVLMRSNLQVAGTLQVGSNLAINGIRVTGNSTFDDVQITKSVAITGNGSVQGQLNIQKSLEVNGGGTFLGTLSAPSLSVGSLQLNGDLTLTHHVSAGGSTPSRISGSALGSGGTVSVSGSDSAGSITVNTGSSPGAGCFITVNFTQRFNSTPHVNITPVGSSAAGISYYINRSTSNFSVCTTNAAPGNATFGFDYIIFD